MNGEEGMWGLKLWNTWLKGRLFERQTLTHQNGSHFTDDIFTCIFMNDAFCILTQNSPKGPINNIQQWFRWWLGAGQEDQNTEARTTENTRNDLIKLFFFVTLCHASPLNWSKLFRQSHCNVQDWLGAEQVTLHYLKQCWHSSLTDICGTRGRWVMMLGNQKMT